MNDVVGFDVKWMKVINYCLNCVVLWRNIYYIVWVNIGLYIVGCGRIDSLFYLSRVGVIGDIDYDGLVDIIVFLNVWFDINKYVRGLDDVDFNYFFFNVMGNCLGNKWLG